MSRPAGSGGAPIRWRNDVGWEMRCDDCTKARRNPCWWPLTFEFWFPRYQKPDGSWTGKAMTRCRACWVERETRNQRERLRRDPEARARAHARHREYRRVAAPVLALKGRLRRERDRKAAA